MFLKSLKVRLHLLYKKYLLPRVNTLSKILSNLKDSSQKLVQGVSIATFLLGLTFAYLNLLYQRLWMLAVCGFFIFSKLDALLHSPLLKWKPKKESRCLYCNGHCSVRFIYGIASILCFQSEKHRRKN